MQILHFYEGLETKGISLLQSHCLTIILYLALALVAPYILVPSTRLSLFFFPKVRTLFAKLLASHVNNE